MTERVRTLWLLTFVLFCALTGGARAICPTGSALEFDGEGDYVQATDSPELSFTPSDSFTITCWVKPHLEEEVGTIVGKFGGVECDFGYGLYYTGDAFVFGVEALYCVDPAVGAAVASPPGSWCHVAGVYDNGDVTIYLNGQLGESGTFDYGPLDTTPRDPFTIGAKRVGATIDGFFAGLIDEVAIFDRVLSAGEIADLMRCGISVDSNPVSYWDFDEGIGQAAHDSSGNDNHAYLGSNPAGIDLHDPNWVLSDVLPEPDYYVDDDGPGDPGPWDPLVSDPCEDGSIEHPFDSIQEAVDTAFADCNAGCCPVILVRDGWYAGPNNYDIETLGMAVTVKSEHGPWYTIIDCGGLGRGFKITAGEGPCTVIDGFTIFDGYASRIVLDGYPYWLGGAIICADSSPTIQNCDMIFNYAYESGGAIHLDRSNATIRRCEILINECGGAYGGAGGGINTYQSEPLIENCVVAGNYGHYSGGITSGADCNCTIINCTVADNYAQSGPDGLECYHNGHANVKNSIFWTDTRWWVQQWAEPDPNRTYLEHIFLREGGSLNISYTDIEGGYEGIYVEDNNCTLTWGAGNLNTDPLFAEYYFFDYHLRSGVGRWTWMLESNGDYNNDGFLDFGDFAIFALFWMQPGPPQYIDLDNDGSLDVNDLALFCSRWLGPGENFSGWVQDDVNSPCIDGGDPCSPYFLEPAPNGGRINMGAYGNTEQASKSTGATSTRRHPDMDHDRDVDFLDFSLFAPWWRDVAADIPADFDYSGWVDEVDLQEFCLWWLWGK